MTDDYKLVTIETLNSGAIGELFSEEFAKILANIGDPNTSAQAERSVTITVKVKPNKDRQTAQTAIEVSSKIAKIRPSESFALLSFDGDRVSAYATDPKQLDLDDGNGDRIVDIRNVK